MSDYKRPKKMIVKLTSAHGRSVKFISSSPYGKITFSRDIKDAVPLTAHERALARWFLGDRYAIERISPSTFEPGTMTFDQIMKASKLPVQPDMF